MSSLTLSFIILRRNHRMRPKLTNKTPINQKQCFKDPYCSWSGPSSPVKSQFEFIQNFKTKMNEFYTYALNRLLGYFSKLRNVILLLTSINCRKSTMIDNVTNRVDFFLFKGIITLFFFSTLTLNVVF